MKLFRIFFTGMFISFLGSLPLGTLNVAAMQIAVTDGVIPAVYFATGAAIVEVAYVRISLIAMKWVLGHKKLFQVLEWAAIVIVLALAVSSFFAASQTQVRSNVLLSGTIHRFWLGVLMSASNPVQIPFWFGWSTVLFTKNILEHKRDQFNTYIIGIGIGSLAASLIFIYGGRYLVDRLNANQRIFQLAMGCIFLITACIMTWKLVKKKPTDPAHQD